MPPTCEDPAIVVEDLHVSYKTTNERSRGVNPMASLFRHARTIRRVDALTEVNFCVPRGSIYAVLGKNGAGKSTLLRVLGGILAPQQGRVSLYGRVSPLLSRGVGFNKQLTGRDNILLGGLCGGMSPQQVDRHVDEIIEFADLADVIDSPMRTYSSGMAARLVFAVSAFLEPEILLIDEALAAGDPRFKERCRAKIDELTRDDVTVVLVSHGLGVVKELAQRCLWLEQGRVQMDGPTDEVLDAYVESLGVIENATTMEDL